MGAAVVLPGNQPPVPAENRVRCDDAGDLRQHPPAEFLASHRESMALGVGQLKWTWATLLPEAPILLPERIDHVFLVAVHPASGRESEEAQSVGPSLRLLRKQPVRLEFPILSLNPGLRQRCVAPDRRHATPCASGGWRCRCGGRPAGYWDHGAPTPRPTANRLRIGRSSAAYWAFIGRLLTEKAHASAVRTSRRRSRTRSCGATSRSRTIMFSPVSPDGPPARAYAVVRYTRRRGGAWRRRRSGARARGAPAPAAPERRRADPRPLRTPRSGELVWRAFDGKPTASGEPFDSTPYGATKRPRLVWLLAGRPLMARVASPPRRRCQAAGVPPRSRIGR